MSILLPVKHQQEGVSLATFPAKTKLSYRPTAGNKSKPWRLETETVIFYYATKKEAIEQQQKIGGCHD